MATTIESRGTGSRGRLHLGWIRGGWIAFGAVVAILALYLLSVLGLVLAVTRPVADEATLRAMVDQAVTDRLAQAGGGEVPEGYYTLSEIAQHNDTATSCWVIVDDLVFDLTEFAKMHPAQYRNCGGDSSTVYHNQHGPVIRDQMMIHNIGQVWRGNEPAPSATPAQGATVVPEGCPAESIGGPINPVTTTYVDPGSWDVDELMLVVEKDCRSIIFIDGRVHEVVGRIDDLGHQMHAPTPSPDGRFVYVIARDGWLSKIDLATLEVVNSIDVGVNSRGTGVTDDGRYLLVGNFEPNTAVLLDADTLDVVKTFEATGSVNGGPVIPSKVGGVVELGTKIYMVLKDVNAVWEIETADPDFPVRKYENLGDGQTPLHDAYVTPDGKYLLAAVQGANKVWVLDTSTGEEVAEVPTGVTPHTGPGATVGNLTFIPTLDPEGVVSVIDTTTWTNVKNIDTGGPSLFIRHNPTAETVDAYPYVWAETALGDRQDEIYVIDVRSLEIIQTLKPVPGESSWHPEFTYDGQEVYVVSQTGNAIVVYDANTFDVIKTIEAKTPSAVFNMGIRAHEPGL